MPAIEFNLPKTLPYPGLRRIFMNLITIDKILDSDLLYDPNRDGDWSNARDQQFRVAERYLPLLEKTVNRLDELCPFGAPSHILTAGIYVDRSGYHGKGQAFDWDGMRWGLNDDDSIIWRAIDYEPHSPDEPWRAREFYLAVQAVLMLDHGVVLGTEYNAAHRDHLHTDDSRSPEWNPQRKSQVIFLQAALNYVWDVDPPLEIDGIYGSKTEMAWTKAPVRFHWITFLLKTARRGFEPTQKWLDERQRPVVTGPIESVRETYLPPVRKLEAKAKLLMSQAEEIREDVANLRRALES